MEGYTYRLRYDGLLQKGSFLWGIGGVHSFTKGDVVETTDYNEVVRALSTNQFHLVEDITEQTAVVEESDDVVEDEAVSSTEVPRTDGKLKTAVLPKGAKRNTN